MKEREVEEIFFKQAEVIKMLTDLVLAQGDRIVYLQECVADLYQKSAILGTVLDKIITALTVPKAEKKEYIN